MTEQRNFDEDMVCDHCHMEIDGPGIPSGLTEGEEFDGNLASGWMHKSAKTCRANISEERYQRMFEDGEFTPPLVPPARKKAP